MRLAISHWQNRVSPVFDVADRLLLIDLIDNVESERRDVTLKDNSVSGRARCVSHFGIDTLICGAISRPLELALSNAGVEVLAQTCGEIDQVFNAYRADRLQHPKYRMPGCYNKPKQRFRV